MQNLSILAHAMEYDIPAASLHSGTEFQKKIKEVVSKKGNLSHWTKQ